MRCGGAPCPVQQSRGTVLHAASLWGCPGGVLRLLAAGVDPDTMNQDGHTPLRELARRGAAGAVVSLLLAAGARLDGVDRHGNTALMLAAIAGDLWGNAGSMWLVQQLLVAGAAPDHQNHDGETALHFAAELDHGEVVVWLLDAGVDPNARNRQGRTALHVAVSKGRRSAVGLLLQRGAQVHIKDVDGCSPLDIADAWWADDRVLDLLQAAMPQAPADAPRVD